MYSNTGYINDIDIEIEDLTQPLSVSGSGIYRLIKLPIMTTTRLSGRNDYQLLYISAGKAFFRFGETDVEVSAGHMVLYRPGEAQHYYYCAKDCPEVAWVHFSGYEADSILKDIGFYDTSILFCETSFHFLQIFQSMTRELQLKRPCFDSLISLYLRQLFAGIKRSQLERSKEQTSVYKEMEKTVDYFNEFFSHDICIEDYAKKQHMSVCWFIHNFKCYMGMTPKQYITSIRINKAKELLKSTDYSIEEIGTLVGYENPLYFSRIFKKVIGCAPSAYRKDYGSH